MAKKRPKRKPGAPGRDTKCTPALIDNAVTLSVSLATDAAICAALKIRQGTWCDWKNKAAGGRQPYVELFERMEEARGTEKISLISKIGADPDWRAKAWLLERLEPETYSLRNKMEHSGPGGAPLPTAGPPPINIIVQGHQAGDDNPYAPPPKDPNKKGPGRPRIKKAKA